MSIYFRYTMANIKSNKSRIPLIIICIVLATIMFYISLIVPRALNNYAEYVRMSFWGKSDVVVMNRGNNYVLWGSKLDIPYQIRDDAQWICPAFALNATIGDYDNLSQTVMSISYEDLMTYTTIELKQGSHSCIQNNQVIISNKTANRLGLKVGDYLTITYADKPSKMQIGAIATDRGMFAKVDKGYVVCSRESMAQITGINVHNLNLFNVCFIKLNNMSVETAMQLLEEAFPEMQINNAHSNEIVDQMTVQNQVPFIISAVLVCIFCVFIIYMTMNIVFTERVKNFATLKSMGATNWALLNCLCFESSIYGLIGSTIGTLAAFGLIKLMPLLFGLEMLYQGFGITYYVITFFFGILFALGASLVPAIKHVKKSIRQTMITSDMPSRTKFYIRLAIGLVFLVIFLGFAFFNKVGDNMGMSIVAALMGLAAVILLVPYLIYALLIIGTFIVKGTSFAGMYIKKSFLNNSTSIVTKTLCFALIIIIFLACVMRSIEVVEYKTEYVDYFNVRIEKINSTPEVALEAAQSMTKADQIYAITILQNPRMVDTDALLYYLHGFDFDDIDKAYGHQVIDKENAYKLMQEHENGILLNIKFKYRYKYKVGQTVKIKHQDVKEDMEYYVCGFIDSLEHNSNFAVAHREYVNKCADINQFNTVLLNFPNEQDVYEAVNQLRTMFKGKSFDVISEVEDNASAMEIAAFPLKLFKAYTIAIIALSTLCVVVSMMLALRQTVHEHKTMNLLGMDQIKFTKIAIMQILLIILVSMCTAVLIIYLAIPLIINILLFLGLYVTISFPILDILLYCGLCAIAVTLGDLILSILVSKKFCNESRNADE